MKLDEFISDILITQRMIKDIFIGGKGRNFRKDIAITKPYNQERENQSGSYFGTYIGPKNDRTLGFQPCDNIADDALCRQKYGDMYSKLL
jgi:hypothetical protein